MSKQQVLQIMGTPGNRQFRFSGRKEAWQWMDFGFSKDHYTVISFYDDRVTGIGGYDIYGGLGGNYRPIIF